jgi:hypothetical protein
MSASQNGVLLHGVNKLSKINIYIRLRVFQQAKRICGTEMKEVTGEQKILIMRVFENCILGQVGFRCKLSSQGERDVMNI